MKRINKDMDNATQDQIRFQLGVILGKQSGSLPEAIAFLDGQKDQVGGHLSHYLKNRSYTKAWKLLRDEGPGTRD